MKPFMKTVAAPAVLAMLTLAGTGCVTQNEADAWRNKYRSAEETVLDLRAQLEEKDGELALLRGRTNPNAAMADQIAALEAERDALQQSLNDAQAALRNAAGSPLPAVLTSELEQLAAQNPDLMTFDPDTGMIRFRSDVTFALGSATVSDDAQGLLRQLAGVLNSPAASGYEVRIVGHTDNVPVRNATNVRKYEDNWGLSAFRAIGVMRVLDRAGVPASRMSVAGYGQHQPVAANGPRGSEANRRVELYLVPSSGGAAAPQPDAAPGAVVPMDNPEEPEAPAMFK